MADNGKDSAFDRAARMLERYPIDGVVHRDGIPVAYSIRSDAQADGGFSAREDFKEVRKDQGRWTEFPPLPGAVVGLGSK